MGDIIDPRQTGHHHEVLEAVLVHRLAHSRKAAAELKVSAYAAHSVEDRRKLLGAARFQELNAESIERELRRRERLTTI